MISLNKDLLCIINISWIDNLCYATFWIFRSDCFYVYNWDFFLLVLHCLKWFLQGDNTKMFLQYLQKKFFLQLMCVMYCMQSWSGFFAIFAFRALIVSYMLTLWFLFSRKDELDEDDTWYRDIHISTITGVALLALYVKCLYPSVPGGDAGK